MNGEQFLKVANIISNSNDINDDEKGSLIEYLFNCLSYVAESELEYDLQNELWIVAIPFVRRYTIQPYYKWLCNEE